MKCTFGRRKLHLRKRNYLFPLFLEKAYFAVTGESLAKAKTDAAAQIDTGTLKRTPLQEEGYNVVIYDAGPCSNT